MGVLEPGRLGSTPSQLDFYLHLSDLIWKLKTSVMTLSSVCKNADEGLGI